MATFLFSYRTPGDYVPFQPDTASAWMAWFDALGTALIDPGRPVGDTGQIGECGAGHRLGGYSIVSADDLEAALELAEGCPGLSRGFGVEVGALLELGPRPA